MSLWSDMEDKNGKLDVRKEELPSIVFSDKLTFSDDEKKRIEKPIIEMHQHPSVFTLKEVKEQLVTEVFVSEKREYLGSYLIDRILLPEKEEVMEKKKRRLLEYKIPILGEYISSEKKIILYINNIKDVPPGPVGMYGNLLTIMRYVYLHELMHAYFDRNHNHKYIYEIEEGFAEFGALLCLKELISENKAESEELDWALSYVASKEDVIHCYSYGATLFSRYKDLDDEAAKQMLRSYL